MSQPEYPDEITISLKDLNAECCVHSAKTNPNKTGTVGKVIVRVGQATQAEMDRKARKARK